ncbi:MAG: YihY/virulence factor BrkB family protein [Moheibacter sp.]
MIKNKFTLDYWKTIGKITIRAAKGFGNDRCMKFSASLAYYTLFSIGPLLLIVIWCIGFFYGTQLEGTSAQVEVFEELQRIFGQNVASFMQSTMERMMVQTDSNLGIIIGIATLIFTSTTIFVDIQDSINAIWGIKPKPKKGWVKMIIDRLLSFSMILGLGFLLIVSLLINSIIMLFTNYITEIIPGITLNMLGWINTAITFLVITTLFGFIFKVLPDAKVRNKDIIGGAIFTSLLFMLGRYGISMYLQHNATASAFGAAGSVIILLLWIYYSAAILYFGAEFTKEHAKLLGEGIQPSSYAVLVAHTEIAVEGGEDTEVQKGEILMEKDESKCEDGEKD